MKTRNRASTVLNLAVVAMAIHALANTSANAAVVVTQVNSPGSGAGDLPGDPGELEYAPDVSSSDLLHGLSGGNVTTTGSWQGGGALELNDGDHGDSFDNIGNPAVSQIAWPTVGSTVTFDLGLGANGLGYDVTSIQSIAAWQSAGFGNQGYTLEVQPVGGSFTTLATVLYNPLGGGAGATKVTLTDDGTGPGGNLATGIQLIRLTQNSVPGTVGGRVTYRELDVFGTASVAVVPEPSTFVVAALGLLGLISFRRRRKRA